MAAGFAANVNICSLLIARTTPVNNSLSLWMSPSPCDTEALILPPVAGRVRRAARKNFKSVLGSSVRPCTMAGLTTRTYLEWGESFSGPGFRNAQE